MRSERALAEPSAARERLVPGVRVRQDMRDRLAAFLPAARRPPSAGRHFSRGTGCSHDGLLSAADLPHRRSSTLAAFLPAARRRPGVGRHFSRGTGCSHDGLLSAADLPHRRSSTLAAFLPAARRRPSVGRHFSRGTGCSYDALLSAADLPQRLSVLGYRIVSGRIATGGSPATARPWVRPDPATDPGRPDSRGPNGCSPTAEARSAGSRGSAGGRESGLPPTMARRSNSGAQTLGSGNRGTRGLRDGACLPRAVTRFPRCDRGAARCECECGASAGASAVGEPKMCRLSVAAKTSCVRTRTVWWSARPEWHPAPESSKSRPSRHVRRRTSAPVRTTAIERIMVRRRTACGRRTLYDPVPAAPRNSSCGMSAEPWFRTTAASEMALRARVGASGSGVGCAVDRLESPPWRMLAEHRITAPRHCDADRVTARLFRAASRHPLWCASVACWADRQHLAAGRWDRPARSQGAGSLISDARCRFVRRRPGGEPTSCRRQLTIRWRAAMNEWTPDDSFTAETRGLLCRVFAEPVVRRELATRSMRFDRCAEASARTRALAALMFRVTDVIAGSARRVEWRTRARSRPMPASGRSARSRADWRWPVRWRTVAE